MNLLHCRRKAKNIDYDEVFGADVDSGHPFEEEVDWLRQFCGASAYGYYLIEGRDSPRRVWHGKENDVNAFFSCIYEEQD